MSTAQDLTGSVYFTYNKSTGAVGINEDKSQLPDALTCQRSDAIGSPPPGPRETRGKNRTG
ncbi:hypothetical protein [Streptomyces mirabilis]|uniref:hypothetical protein n=1 Tax=Streptomyces mirabilis TaxID=68239 RepID=UPI00344945EE